MNILKVIKQFSIGFFGVWLLAHGIYDFSVLKWSTFIDWSDITRAVLMVYALGAGAFMVTFSR